MANNTLDGAIAGIEKMFGRGSIFTLDSKKALDVDVISTGSLSFDMALGVGGMPRGRVVEIFGPESSGKTTAALQVVAEAQKLKDGTAYIDMEHALDPGYARKLGVDTKKLLISQPDYGEQGLEIAQALIESGKIGVIVIDSVAALVPKAELEGEMGQSMMGLQARLMSQAMRKLTGIVHKTNTLMIFINQIRDKIGVMFGSPETTTGGRALKFYASVRADIRKIQLIKDGETVLGARTRIKIVKNKVSTPHKEAETDLIYGKGFSKEGDIVDLGVIHGIIEKSGAWYTYNKANIGQGRNNVAAALELDNSLAEEIEAKIRKKVKDEQTKESEI